MKKLIITFLVIILIPFNCVSAYASEPANDITIESSNIPDGTAYIEILVLMDSNDESYTAFNSENMAQYTFDSKELSDYNEDGYISLSCHFKNNYTEMTIDPHDTVNGIISWNYYTLVKYENAKFGRNDYTMTDLVTQKRKLKIAVIDENGKILQVSDSFDIVKNSKLFLDMIEYDVSNNVVHMEWDEKPFKISFTVNRDKEAIIMISILGLIVFLLVIASIILIVKRIKKHCKK